MGNNFVTVGRVQKKGGRYEGHWYVKITGEGVAKKGKLIKTIYCEYSEQCLMRAGKYLKCWDIKLVGTHY